MSDKAHFDINAAVVRQLGEELVSDEITALIELVKNSYDADASYASIIVDTKNFLTDEQYFYNIDQNEVKPGYILIEDDGFGMDEDDIKNGWLTISFSGKRRMKTNGELTPLKSRTPLGEKGLGRLSSQRLGNRLELFTTKAQKLIKNNGKHFTNHIAFDWHDFSEEKSLTTVPVFFEAHSPEKSKQGTKLVITNLQNPDIWEGENSQNKLVGQLSQLLFPFEEVRPFNVYLSINGKRFDLLTISAKLREVSLSQFSFSYNSNDDKKLHIKGKIKLPRLKGLGEENEDVYDKLLGYDQGKTFFSYFYEKNKKISPDISFEGSSGWFISFSKSIELKSIGDLSILNNNEIADPGTFHGEIDEFFLRGVNLSPLENIYSSVSDYKSFVSQHVGIRIYRDGFGIRPYGFDGYDWLDLGKGQTSGLSFYGLRPNNVIGFVALTAKDNWHLQEKTDREGFVDSPYSRNFRLIMGYFVQQINYLFHNLRRSYNHYKSIPTNINPHNNLNTNIFEDIREANSQAIILEKRTQNLEDGLNIVTESLQDIVKKVHETPLLATVEEQNLSPIILEANEKLSEAHKIASELFVLLQSTRVINDKAISLEAKMTIMQDQLQQFSELAGLGLTAEALSHEIAIITDNLASKTKAFLETSTQETSTNSMKVTYAEYVRSAISALRKQLSHLAPSLRYLRETKDNIHIASYFSEIQNFYNERFSPSDIKIILVEPFEDFSILMNKGKVTQIIDNIFLNSEYWLKEALKRKEISNPVIFVKSSYPKILIWDNGRGFDPSIEDTIFQPFVTSKPKNIGRGLGLFIVQELLDSSGCSVALLQDKNEFGRKYILNIDLTGVIYARE